MISRTIPRSSFGPFATPALVMVLSTFLALACGAPSVPLVDPATGRETELKLAFPMPTPPEYAERPVSKEAGGGYFLETGGGDPYAAGMAFPVFLALMDAFPNELGADMNAFRAKFGFHARPDQAHDPSAIPLGFHLTTDPDTGVPWLVGNCQMCHAERIRLETGDVVVAGMGNHRVRPHAYAAALARIGTSPSLDKDRILDLAEKRARERHLSFPEPMREPIVKATLEGLAEGSKRRIAGLLRFETALPGRMATIESFALALGPHAKSPIALPETIGWAKVPDVRGFAFRETASWDGSGAGSPEALVAEADFLFGARPEWYATHRHIATSMYLFLKTFTRRFPYPGKIDGRLVAAGRTAFEAKCAGCHGFYVDHGGEMRVSYKEQVVPQGIVGTDPAREEAVTPSFVAASNDLPLTKGLTRVAATGGYVPPVLLDVWSRGLYGHVGQWPSLEVLGMKPAERPSKFVVDDDGKYDVDRLGVRYEVWKSGRKLSPSEYVYDGTKPGYSVLGHPYFADLPIDVRRAVLEYLKTL